MFLPDKDKAVPETPASEKFSHFSQGRPLKAKSFAVVSLIRLSHVAYDILWSLIRIFFGVFLLSVSYISGNTFFLST